MKNNITVVSNITSNLNNKTLTDFQQEILLGLLLGDSCFHFRNKNKKSVRLEFKVGKKNYSYLIHLIEIYKELFNVDTKIGETKTSFYIKTKTMKILYPFYTLFYINGKKVITDDLLNSKFFTEKTLAYWFMDDGHCENKAGRYKISTQCFSLENQKLLQIFLKTKFQIETTLYKKDGSHILVIKRGSTNRFRLLVEPYIIDSMKYKLGTFLRDNHGFLIKQNNNNA